MTKLRRVNNPELTNVGQMEVHAAKALIFVPSPFKTEIVVANLKRYKLPSIYQFPGGETLRSEIHKLIS
jgi:hypothetical protein